MQAAAAINDQKTKAREMKALVKASNELSHAQAAELILLVPDINETVEYDGKKVHIINVKEWLLGIY